MSTFAKLSAFTALALAASSLVTAAPTPPQVDIVRTINCTLAASGKLALVAAGQVTGFTPLGLTDGTNTRVLDRLNGIDDTHTAFDFYQCDASIEGYTNTPQKMYGHIQVKASGACLTGRAGEGADAGSTTFVVERGERCSLSDDSGQASIYFSYEPNANAQPFIQYVGYNGKPPPYSYSFGLDGNVLAKGNSSDGSHLSFN